MRLSCYISFFLLGTLVLAAPAGPASNLNPRVAGVNEIEAQGGGGAATPSGSGYRRCGPAPSLIQISDTCDSGEGVLLVSDASPQCLPFSLNLRSGGRRWDQTVLDKTYARKLQKFHMRIDPSQWPQMQKLAEVLSVQLKRIRSRKERFVATG
ncbi:hypothetical protein BJV77DRAFT_1151444 [Russula vinacea]|nr:hypothetical protein BJV77DRAFT_1151444 [Russula vinacea]